MLVILKLVDNQTPDWEPRILFVISRRNSCNTYKKTKQKDRKDENRGKSDLTFWKVEIWRVGQSIREGGGQCEIILDYENDEVAIIC